MVQITEQIKAAIVKREGQVDVVVFDGATTKPADILDECRSMGLMMQPKLVIVENADQLLKESEEEEAGGAPAAKSRFAQRSPREIMEAYARQPESSATLVLRAEQWRGGNLEKAITLAGGVVHKCEPMGEAQASAWAVQHAKSLGATISPQTAEVLVELLGAELGRIASELQKLSIAAGGQGAEISGALVRQLVGASREEDAWSIQSVLLTGDVKASLENLHSRLDVSRVGPVVISLAYLDLARKLDGAARGLISKENPFAMRTRLRLWGLSEPAILAVAGRMGVQRTARLLAAATDADMRMKSGGGDQTHILEGLTRIFAVAMATR